MFENPRRGWQARNFTTNVPKIIDLKSSSEQIFSENWRCVPLFLWLLRTAPHYLNAWNRLHEVCPYKNAMRLFQLLERRSNIREKFHRSYTFLRVQGSQIEEQKGERVWEFKNFIKLGRSAFKVKCKMSSGRGLNYSNIFIFSGLFIIVC